MLSLIDCIAFSGLTRDQLDALACHEHLPLIVVAEWAETTLESEGGRAVVESILAEEVRFAAIHHRDRQNDWGKALAEFRMASAC